MFSKQYSFSPIRTTSRSSQGQTFGVAVLKDKINECTAIKFQDVSNKNEMIKTNCIKNIWMLFVDQDKQKCLKSLPK